MDSGDVVACVVTVSGTALGIVQIARNGDGSVITAMVGLYGTILGYVFGKKLVQAQQPQEKTP